MASPTVVAGWLYHLFNSVVIGAAFGWLLGARVHGLGSGVGWGAGYGFAWWILGGLVLMPVLVGMSPFAPLTMPPMRAIAMGSLIGHLIYGAVLGAVFAALFRGAPHGAAVRPA